jgi:ADP-L-glycero-D-manno-heptose 6-epimerase
MDGNVLLKNNVDYSIDLIEACVDVGIPIHFASSASIFGNLQANGGTVSAHTTDPLNPYAYSKALVDEHIKSLESRQTGDYPNPDIVSFRYFNVYGLGEDHKDGQSSPILKFYNEARETGEISVFDIESSRDFVNIYDVVAAHIEDLNNFETFRKHNTGTRNSIKFLDVGTACPLSFIQVAEIVADFIERQTKEKIRIKIVPFPKSLKNNYQFYTRASNSILYEPLTERESAMHIRKYLDRLLDRDEEMKKLLVPLQKNESYTRKKSLI